MGFYTLNDNVRKDLINKYDNLNEKNAFFFVEEMQHLKSSDEEQYYLYLSVMYPFLFLEIVYLYDYIKNNKNIFNQYSSCINMICNIHDIYDLDTCISNDYNILFKLYNATIYFEKLSYYDKLKFISKSKDYDKKILSISKLWIYDKFSYNIIFTKDGLLEKISELKNDIYLVHKNTCTIEEKNGILLYEISNYLSDLMTLDKENFSKLFSEIIDDSSKYYKLSFLNSCGDKTANSQMIDVLNKSKEDIIYEINHDFKLLFNIVEGFYKYNNKFSDEINNDDYFISDNLKKKNYNKQNLF